MRLYSRLGFHFVGESILDISSASHSSFLVLDLSPSGSIRSLLHISHLSDSFVHKVVLLDVGTSSGLLLDLSGRFKCLVVFLLFRLELIFLNGAYFGNFGLKHGISLVSSGSNHCASDSR